MGGPAAAPLSGDGDVRERAGGGQEEPERGAGREREAVSVAVGRGRAAGGCGAGPGCCGVWSPSCGLHRAARLYRVCVEAAALAWLRAPLWGVRNNAFRVVSAPCPLSPRYWANLKLWFKQKISKEEFDLEARRLLTQDNGKKATLCLFSCRL